jgi:hypothetical protein
MPTYMDISESPFCGRRHSETDFIAQHQHHHHPCSELPNDQMGAGSSVTKSLPLQKRPYTRRRCSSAEHNVENDDVLVRTRRPRRNGNCNGKGTSPDDVTAASSKKRPQCRLRTKRFDRFVSLPLQLRVCGFGCFRMKLIVERALAFRYIDKTPENQ